jgi:GT2 family glycosyltransferase
MGHAIFGNMLAASDGTHPQLSIIILNWNSRDYCIACLESLAAAGWSTQRAQIIVVDNGSADDSVEAIGRRFPGAVLVRNQKNRGIAGGRNDGIKVATGGVLLFLDVDTVVRPGAIDAMLETLAQHQVGVVGPRLQGASGALQYSCRLFPTLPGKLARRFPLRPLQHWSYREELLWWNHEDERDVDYVLGACQMVRRGVIEMVGGYEKSYFYGPDDVDFCLRAQLAGWRVVYQPRAVIEHAERRVTRRLRINLFVLRHGVALVHYFVKNHYLFSRRGLYRRIAAARKGKPVTSAPSPAR